MMQEFVQQVQTNMDETIKGMHTAMPGKITAFDGATGLASIMPTMQFKTPSGEAMDYPQLTGVPVVIPQSMAQQATIAFPIKPGDGCLVIIAEQSIDYWMQGQDTGSDLAFDLTNAICIPGMFVPANPVLDEATKQNAVIVDVQGTRVVVTGGKITLSAASVIIEGNLTVNGSVNATQDVVAGAISLQNHTHTGDSGGTTGSAQ